MEVYEAGACPYPDYGTLNAKVKAISPDAVAPQSNNAASTNTNNISKATAPRRNYQVSIKPQTMTLRDTKNKCQIQFGMDGRADIITREETVVQFFLRKAKLITDL